MFRGRKKNKNNVSRKTDTLTRLARTPCSSCPGSVLNSMVELLLTPLFVALLGRSCDKDFHRLDHPQQQQERCEEGGGEEERGQEGLRRGAANEDQEGSRIGTAAFHRVPEEIEHDCPS